MAQINLLSKEVSELIAAGEVIDRPSSVIKELLENSIDAGANVITVEIKNGGRTYLRVTDNGSGITSQDVKKAFLRHATSKISTKEDLSGILTLGFRGEALASISAVAKVELLTKTQEDAYGTHYMIEGGEERLLENSGCPDGTTFIVRDIFYNVPARLKFLKKDTSEGNYAANLITKLALSHPEISFKFIRDNKVELLTAGDGKLYSGIYSVFGREFAKSLIPVEHSWNGIHVYGYIAKPLSSKPNRKFQNFFVNGRYVMSKTCCGALEEAYRNSIMTGKFPACVLCIEVSPEIVDVNVHPTKIEVRFSDDKLIYEAIFFAVKNSLMTEDKPAEITFGEEKHFSHSELTRKAPAEKAVQMKIAVQEQPQSANKQPSVVKAQQDSDTASSVTSPPADINPAEDNSLQPVVPAVMREPQKPSDSEIHDFSEAAKRENTAVTQEIIEEISDFRYISDKSFERRTEIVEESVEEPSVPIVIGELFKTYIVAQHKESMLLFDKHAAHERYIFEKIKSNADELEAQQFLEPILVLLSYDEFDALSANVDKAARLGFDIEPDLAPTVAVKGVPVILGDENPTDIVTELAKNFLAHKHDPQIEIFDELYHSVACKAAIKANDYSDIVELQTLVNMIWDRDDIKYCPHGRPVMIKLSRKDIEKQFKRIV